MVLANPEQDWPPTLLCPNCGAIMRHGSGVYCTCSAPLFLPYLSYANKTWTLKTWEEIGEEVNQKSSQEEL